MVEVENRIMEVLQKKDKIILKSFIYAFVLINIAYAFHSINFMFGDHDWNYVRGQVTWNEGTFEGRPLHFLLQNIFFGGSVLPLLNNMLSFAFMALSGILLAKYWRIPKTVLNYTVFSSFIAILPYTLVWLYYAKDTLINMALPLICILGLMLAEKAEKNKKLHLLAIGLLLFAFSSYIAVVNFIGVVVLSQVLINYLVYHEDILNLIRQKMSVILDCMIALVLYLLILQGMNLTSDYNTKMIDWAVLPDKLRETISVMFSQFYVQLPFMEFKYKMLLLASTVLGGGILLQKGGLSRLYVGTFLILCILFCSKFAFFIADERGQILAEMENFAYVPRLDFYGLVYIYALGVCGILLSSREITRKWSIALVCVIIFMSAVRDMYAQKVWKLGFDAEMKAHERIVGRIESKDNFMQNRKYRLLQIGSLSLRKNFYREVAEEKTSLDLLSTSYTPEFMSYIVYNFYYPEDIFYGNATVNDLSPAGKMFLKEQAEVWPMQNSIYIDGDVIIIIVSDEGLYRVRQKM